jgi:hypothetical protein
MKKEMKFSIDTPDYLRLKSDGKNETTEVVFEARPINFTILNSEGVLFKPKSDWELFDGSGNLEVVFIDAKFDNNISGYLTEIDNMTLSIAITCSSNAIKLIVENFKEWNDVDATMNVEIEGAEISSNNFRMLDKQYRISSWSLKMPKAEID